MRLNRLLPSAKNRFGLLILAFLTAVFPRAPAPAAELTPAEQRGRQIYEQGSGSEKSEIFAVVRRGGVRVPAKVLPCVGCHGEDGRGRPEGGVEPANITWVELTKSYGHRHDNGRVHAAFDESGFALAVSLGLDPAGNTLDQAMPKYEMATSDMAALIAYLKRLGVAVDPGVTETSITVGTLLPRGGRYGARGRVIEAVLRAYFDEINAAGGIYGRKLALAVAEYRPDREASLAEARRLIEQEEVFAVVGAFAIGLEQPLFSLLEEAGVPQIGPFTLLSGHADLSSDATFFLESGLANQARALVVFGAQDLGLESANAALVLPSNAVFDPVAQAVTQESEVQGWPRPLVARLTDRQPAPVGLAGQLSREGVETVIHFGSARSLLGFAAEAARQGWHPHLLLPGMIAGETSINLPSGFAGRIYVAYPSLPSDFSPDGDAEIKALQLKYGFPGDHLLAQGAAYAAAKVLVEGLSRAGRGLTRTTLVTALEQLSEFETGLMRPISFGPNRRVGARGAQVVAVDLAGKTFDQNPTWIRLD